MSFPQFAPSPKSVTIRDLLVAVAFSAVTLAGLTPSAASADAWLAAPLVPLGMLLWWVSGLELRGWLRKFGFLVFPAYFLLSAAYLMFGAYAFILDPRSASLVVGAQILALLYLLR